MFILPILVLVGIFVGELFYFLYKKVCPQHVPARVAASLAVPLAMVIYGFVSLWLHPDPVFDRGTQFFFLFMAMWPLFLLLWLPFFPLFLFKGASWKWFLLQLILFGALLCAPALIK